MTLIDQHFPKHGMATHLMLFLDACEVGHELHEGRSVEKYPSRQLTLPLPTCDNENPRMSANRMCGAEPAFVVRVQMRALLEEFPGYQDDSPHQWGPATVAR